MATVEFECPKCGQVCAFGDQHVGRRARCTKCNTCFLIPRTGQRAYVLKPAVSEDGPWSGFWTALFKGTPAALCCPDSLAATAILIILSVLRFALGHPFYVIPIPIFLFVIPVPVGIFVTVLTALSQSRYVFNIIQSAADHSDPLPPYMDGNCVDRFFDGIVSAYTFAVLAAVFLAPAGLAFLFTKTVMQARWPVVIAAAVGLFFLPFSMAIYAYSRDLILSFRLDYIVRAARKAFWPYLAVYVLTLAVAVMFWKSSFYAFNAPPETFFRDGVMHAAATVLMILAARTGGLFYRHYGCFLP